MKRIVISLLSLSLLAACGKQEDNSLEGLKVQLAEKKAQQAQLQMEIKGLETQLNKLDPQRKQQLRTRAVTVANVEPMQFRHFIQVQGTVEAEENVMVNIKSPSIITKVNVKVGDRVRKGQVLAVGDVSVLQASMSELQTALELANDLFEKQKNLHDQKIGSEVAYLQAKNQKESLEQKLVTLRKQMDLSRITSPMDGVVDEVRIKEGEVANPGMGVIRVVNTSDIKVVARVADTYVRYVKQGDAVRIKLPDLDGTVLDARITFVSQVVDPSSRTFNIEVALPKGQQHLRPNMIAVIEINDKTIDQALVIDQNLVMKTEEGTVVYVAEQTGNSMVARARKVNTGLSYAGQIEVKDGLKPGDRLITFGNQDLVDGQPIKL